MAEALGQIRDKRQRTKLVKTKIGELNAAAKAAVRYKRLDFLALR